MSTPQVSSLSHTRPRLVVPDVARGLALLGIAMANVSAAWIITHDRPASHFGGIINDSVLDKAAVLFAALFVHVRGLPMFSTLLGFGVGLIALSLWRREFPLRRARRVLIRRYGWLFVFGAVHCIFLFYGDIMIFYGLAGILLALLLPLSDRALMIVAWILLALTGLAGLGFGVLGYVEPSLAVNFSAGGMGDPVDTSSYPHLVGSQFMFFLLQLAGTPLVFFNYLPLMIIGFVWARRGTLGDVASHRTQLISWCVAGCAVIVLVGLPWGLGSIGVVPESFAAAGLMANSFLGVFTGPAILAATALALHGVQERVSGGATLPRGLWALAALGKRSMSGYLGQSVLFFALVYPFTLNFGPQFGAAGQMAIAFGVWLITLFLACILEARGLPGPFEWLHRRVSYGKTMRPEPTPRLAPGGVKEGVDKQELP